MLNKCQINQLVQSFSSLCLGLLLRPYGENVGNLGIGERKTASQ
jgi:hypothetical protein